MPPTLSAETPRWIVCLSWVFSSMILYYHYWVGLSESYFELGFLLGIVIIGMVFRGALMAILPPIGGSNDSEIQ